MKSRENLLARPELKQSPAVEVANFRKFLELTQAQLAGSLGVTPLTVLLWEKGRSVPSTEAFIKLAMLAKENVSAKKRDALKFTFSFLERAGLNRTTLVELNREAASEATRSLNGAEERIRAMLNSHANDFARVPVIRTAAHVASPTLVPAEEIETTLALPRQFIPHPERTSCLRVEDDLVSLSLGGDRFLAFDSSFTEKELLWQKMVLVQYVGDPTRFTSSQELLKDETATDKFIGFLHPFIVEGRTVPFLSTTEILPDWTVLPSTKGPARGGILRRRAPSISMMGLEAAFAMGQIFALDPEVDWKILARAVCSITSSEKLASEEPKIDSTL
jgi:DNA-binding XRE family transcriptional regulator